MNKIKNITEKLEILGNGDVERGAELLTRFVDGLERARKIHTAEEWQSFTKHDVSFALLCESKELRIEINSEYQDGNRIEEESLDVMIVAARIFLREWE